MGVSSAVKAAYEQVNSVEDSDGDGCKVLCLQAPSQQYPQGAVLFDQWGNAGDIYFIEQGVVKLIHLGENGQELIVGLRTSGSLLGAPPTLLGVAHPVSAVTLTPCRLRRIPAEVLRRLLESNPDLSNYLLKEQCREMLDQIDQLTGLGLSAQQRLEKLLMRLASSIECPDKSKGMRLPLLLRHWEIAQLIGVTPQHLCRLVKKMEKDETIRIEKGWLIIANPERALNSSRQDCRPHVNKG